MTLFSYTGFFSNDFVSTLEHFHELSFIFQTYMSFAFLHCISIAQGTLPWFLFFWYIFYTSVTTALTVEVVEFMLEDDSVQALELV